MKIDDSPPPITEQQPRRAPTRFIVALATVGAIALGLAAALLYQHRTHVGQLDQVNHDLATVQASAKEAEARLASITRELDTTRATASSCATGLTAATSKVAAFAKQAAACEVIRTKLRLGD